MTINDMEQRKDDRYVVKYHMQQNALDLAEHAKTLSIEIAEGRYEVSGDLNLNVALEHLMDHIAYLWHLQNGSPKDLNSITSDDYNAIVSRIPKFNDRYTFVEI